MDTVKGAVQSDEGKVLGNSQGAGHEEPVSGVEGAGTGTEPYDAGNATEQPGNALRGYSEDSAAPLAANSSENLQHAGGGQEKLPSAESTLGSSQNQANSQGHGYNQPAQSTQKEEPAPSSTPEQSETARKPGEDVPPPSSGDTREGGPKQEGSESAEAPQSTDEILNKEAEPVPQEKTYRSTGFAAEGGNFDAKASGAGKEADRLLTARGSDVGVRQTVEETHAPHEPHSGGIWNGGHRSGVSVSKAKEKLHIGKH